MPTEIQIYSALNKYRDATLATFEEHLRIILQRAQDAATAYIVKAMDIDDGVLEATLTNARIARTLAAVFTSELDRAGYQRLVNAFVGSFHEQLPTIQEILHLLSDQMASPLAPLKFTPADLKLLSSTAVSAGKSIRDEIAAVSQRAFSRVMFSVGGLPYSQMVDIIRSGTAQTLTAANVLAETSQATFFRVALQGQFDKIQKNVGRELRYKYSGPNDSRERPFCKAHTLETTVGKSWSRGQINEMDNGASQPKPVSIFCGGWRCRHQWAVDVRASGLLAQKAA